MILYLNMLLLPLPRFALVVAYLVTPYGASERAWKPFNPILGETFELDVGNGVKYFAEQVRCWGLLHTRKQQHVLYAIAMPSKRAPILIRSLDPSDYLHLTCLHDP